MADFVLPFPGRTIAVTYSRDGEEATIPVTIADLQVKDRFGNKARIGLIGVGSQDRKFVRVGPLEAGAVAVEPERQAGRADGHRDRPDPDRRTLGPGARRTGQNGQVFGRTGCRSDRLLSSSSWPSFQLTWHSLTSLPIPALDGGHLAFYAAEAVRRKPLGPRSQEWAFRTGLAFVLALMLFVTINDVASLSLFGGGQVREEYPRRAAGRG